MYIRYDRGGAPSQKLGEQGEQNTPKIRNLGVLLHFYVTISESWGSNCTPCTPGCAATATKGMRIIVEKTLAFLKQGTGDWRIA